MKKVIPTQDAKQIEAKLNEKGFDFEIGYDNEGLLHIQCGHEDEIKIQEVVESMNLPYEAFMWFGTFASDVIVEDLVA